MGMDFGDLGLGFMEKLLLTLSLILYVLLLLEQASKCLVRPELQCSDSFEVMGINRPLLEHKWCD